MKDVDKKVAVSPSRPLNCSTDVNLNRATPARVPLYLKRN